MRFAFALDPVYKIRSIRSMNEEYHAFWMPINFALSIHGAKCEATVDRDSQQTSMYM